MNKTINALINAYINDEELNKEQRGIYDTMREFARYLVTELKKNEFYEIGYDTDPTRRTITISWYQKKANPNNYWIDRELIPLFILKCSLAKGSNKYDFWSGTCQYYTIKTAEISWNGASVDSSEFGDMEIIPVIDKVRAVRYEIKKQNDIAKKQNADKNLQVLKENGFDSKVDFANAFVELFKVVKQLEGTDKGIIKNCINQEIVASCGCYYSVKF